MTDLPSADDFRVHVGEPVFLPDDGARALVAVEAHDPPPDREGGEAATRRPFRLLLRGPRAPVVAEGLHRLVLAGGRAFDLYLIPVHTPSPGHQDYQIVFN